MIYPINLHTTTRGKTRPMRRKNRHTKIRASMREITRRLLRIMA